MLATPLFFFNRRLVGVPDQWAVMVADRPLKIQRKNSGSGNKCFARNWHDDAISPELGSFCQKSYLIAGLIGLS